MRKPIDIWNLSYAMTIGKRIQEDKELMDDIKKYLRAMNKEYGNK